MIFNFSIDLTTLNFDLSSVSSEQKKHQHVTYLNIIITFASLLNFVCFSSFLSLLRIRWTGIKKIRKNLLNPKRVPNILH